jgi:hypothetical protein
MLSIVQVEKEHIFGNELQHMKILEVKGGWLGMGIVYFLGLLDQMYDDAKMCNETQHVCIDYMVFFWSIFPNICAQIICT